MDKDFVENITASLVREYLSRKNLRTTLATMDEELPRTEDSISNRNKLIQILKLERLSRKNKELPDPLRTMLEIMAKYFLDKASQGTRGSTPAIPSEKPLDRENTKSSLDGNQSEESPRSHKYIKKSSRKNSVKTESEAELLKTVEKSSPLATEAPQTVSEPVMKHKPHTGDLVIEESLEGETILGGGRVGVTESHQEDVPVKQPVARPRSAVRRGMAGPISSNLDDREKRRLPRKPSARPYSSKTMSPVVKPEQPELQDTPKPEHKTIEPDLSLGSPYETVIKEAIIPRNETEQKPTEKISTPIKDVLKLDSSPARPRSARRSSQDNVILSDSDPVKTAESVIRPRTARKKDIPLERENSYDAANSSISVETLSKRESSEPLENDKLQLPPSSTKVGDLEIGDIDDLENELADLDLQTAAPPSLSRSYTTITDSRPIDIQTAVELKTLIFGSASQGFNDEWKNQSFGFCDIPGLEYGIVQHKGGPCGVMASVQACMLKELLFGVGKDSKNKLTPDRELRSLCLATAISDILWRAGEQEMAVVAIPTGRSIFIGSGRYKPDDLTETLVLNHFTSHDELLTFMKSSIQVYEMDGSSGVVLLLYSAILSRSIEKVRNDMDVPTGQLMGAHGYCTQEMVNLLMTGHSVSNVFNEQMELDSGGEGPTMILKGIQGRSDIGLLSLFEHYESCQVGTYLKTPKFPIWVVCSESHFSVTFSTKKELMTDWRAERRFEMYYFDGLGKQDEVIRLTVDTSNRFFEPPSEDELVPPLEHCIRTKWKDAQIDWNGTEPLL